MSALLSIRRANDTAWIPWQVLPVDATGAMYIEANCTVHRLSNGTWRYSDTYLPPAPTRHYSPSPAMTGTRTHRSNSESRSQRRRRPSSSCAPSARRARWSRSQASPCTCRPREYAAGVTTYAVEAGRPFTRFNAKGNVSDPTTFTFEVLDARTGPASQAGLPVWLEISMVPNTPEHATATTYADADDLTYLYPTPPAESRAGTRVQARGTSTERPRSTGTCCST